jgi:hypothetical protein
LLQSLTNLTLWIHRQTDDQFVATGYVNEDDA